PRRRARLPLAQRLARGHPAGGGSLPPARGARGLEPGVRVRAAAAARAAARRPGRGARAAARRGAQLGDPDGAGGARRARAGERRAMNEERADFTQYLSRHYAHLGDQQRYRARRKRQLLRTYAHLLPARREAELLEIGPGYGQWLELLRVDRGYAHATAVDVSPEVVEFCNRALPGSTTLAPDTVEFLAGRPARFARIFAFHVLEHVP